MHQTPTDYEVAKRREAMNAWRRNNPDKVNLSRIRQAAKLCKLHPEYGFQVVTVGQENANETQLQAAALLLIRNGYAVARKWGVK